jgi:hypothetical protein
MACAQLCELFAQNGNAENQGSSGEFLDTEFEVVTDVIYGAESGKLTADQRIQTGETLSVMDCGFLWPSQFRHDAELAHISSFAVENQDFGTTPEVSHRDFTVLCVKKTTVEEKSRVASWTQSGIIESGTGELRFRLENEMKRKDSFHCE